MMNRQLAAMVLATSVVGGIAVGMTAHGLTTDRQPKVAPSQATVPAPAAAEVPDIEVKDPALVMNDDETATLSATLVNHTNRALQINEAFGGMSADYSAPILLGYRGTPKGRLEPEVPMTIGRTGDSYRFRFRERVEIGSILPITLDLQKARYGRPASDVTFSAPVVARSAEHAGVANNGPNTAISVRDAVIVVVPGQKKAYVGGSVDSTIDDGTDIRPTAEAPSGRQVEFLHQTATGGPSGFVVQAGATSFGGPTYLDTGMPGDRDYVRAGDVKIGETIEVTIRFPSGDVVAKFKVVQGNRDGTI